MKFFVKHKKIVATFMVLVMGTGILATPLEAVYAQAPTAPSTPSSGPAAAPSEDEGSTIGARVLKGAGLTVAAVGAGLAFFAGGGVVAVGAGIASALAAGYKTWAAGEAYDIANGKGVGAAVYSTVFLLSKILNFFLAWFNYLAANVFNWAIQINILTSYNEIPAVKAGWKIIRDIMNMVFIFLLLYVAIGTILQTGGINWKSTVTSIIVAALLVNFSMLIASIFIDASNILTKEFYDAITEDNTRRMSDMLIQGTAIAKILDPSTIPEKASYTEKSVRIILICLLFAGLIKFFFTCAWLFVGRAVAFVFLMMTSPIALVGSVLPKTKQYADRWWNTLLDQAMLGPFVMFVLYFVLSIVGKTGETFTIARLAEDDPAKEYTYIFLYMIIIAIVNFGLTEAKKMSGEAGSAALSFGKQATGYLGGAVLGGFATGLTAGVGAPLSVIDERWKPSSVGGKWIKDNIVSRGAKGSWDLRNANIAGFGVGDVFSQTMDGASLGAGLKTGGAAGIRDVDSEVKNLNDIVSNIKSDPGIEAQARTTLGAGASQDDIDTEVRRIRGERIAQVVRQSRADVRSKFYEQLSGSDKEFAYAGADAAGRQAIDRYGQNLRGAARAEHLIMTGSVAHNPEIVLQGLGAAGGDLAKIPVRLLTRPDVMQELDDSNLSVIMEGARGSLNADHRRRIFNTFVQIDPATNRPADPPTPNAAIRTAIAGGPNGAVRAARFDRAFRYITGNTRGYWDPEYQVPAPAGGGAGGTP